MITLPKLKHFAVIYLANRMPLQLRWSWTGLSAGHALDNHHKSSDAKRKNAMISPPSPAKAGPILGCPPGHCAGWGTLKSILTTVQARRNLAIAKYWLNVTADQWLNPARPVGQLPHQWQQALASANKSKTNDGPWAWAPCQKPSQRPTRRLGVGNAQLSSYHWPNFRRLVTKPQVSGTFYIKITIKNLPLACSDLDQVLWTTKPIGWLFYHFFCPALSSPKGWC